MNLNYLYIIISTIFNFKILINNKEIQLLLKIVVNNLKNYISISDIFNK